MTDAPPVPGHCAGFGPVAAVTSSDLPRGAASVFPELAKLADNARAAALTRHAWLDAPDLAAQFSVPSGEHLASLVWQAMSAGDPGLIQYLPDSEGNLVDPELPPPDPAGPQGTASDGRELGDLPDGGAILQRASRFSIEIADLCDELALAIGGPVGSALALGRIPTDSALFTAFNVVVRLDPDDPRADRTIDPGRVDLGWGAATLILHGQRLTVGDVWDVARRKAAHWPRLRADLPFDLSVDVEAYGLPTPVDPVVLLVDQFHELFSDELFDDAVAAARARVRPVPRPLGDNRSRPAGLADWADLVVAGRFPGGIGRLDAAPGDGNWLVFADSTVQVEDHLMDLVTTLLGGAPTRVSDLVPSCPHEDPHCAARAIKALHGLGAVAIFP